MSWGYVLAGHVVQHDLNLDVILIETFVYLTALYQISNIRQTMQVLIHKGGRDAPALHIDAAE